ncbi:S-adenosyl-L-methionine-dependent methyltransferase [Hypoxylon fragiforme]|uniref:S-adenosyl-L-methionine-dependent methyltransferase n=1 Tax=Hypoxylon fragiforme TaxID=63214 RepID=UPI0020C7386D|nr:S-adenosyl-L-methionine-dependent methyltransferase [Hypoxylon fragiforme]KAI2606873.1 S-adenosyl-L-methionine-dependent methyltransferase [Hypoxylon fragiforme]
MAAALASQAEQSAPAKELGFSYRQGVNWSKYIAFRPQYPVSFFERIYSHHSKRNEKPWSVAHDVGAGAGIVSSTLAASFDKVIVSDPNDGYVTLARKLLVEEASLPESKFVFLQEPAENSSVASGTVDLVTACECIHWTAVDAAVREFGRELRAGGTLAVTYYTRPLIEAGERAQVAWKGILNAVAERARGGVYENVYPLINTAFDHLGFPKEEWEDVTRVYINADGNTDGFVVDSRLGESKVKEWEEQIWISHDEDWCNLHGIEWFKAYMATWVPLIPESEIQGLWDEMELELGGNPVKTRTPIVMIFATKKA